MVAGVGLVLAAPEILVGAGIAASIGACASGATIVGGFAGKVGEIIDS